MRGKAYDSVKVFTRPRITPAYAGKRVAVVVLGVASWDHPRVCGEKNPPGSWSGKW